jgi:histidine triad (HIT) family protein
MVSGDINADVVFQDDKVLAFRDIHPQAPWHLLLIPKQHIANLNELHNIELGGYLLQTAAKLAAEYGFAEPGYRTVFNCNGDGGQTVFHLHMHLLAGRQMTWPPG